MSEPGQPIQRLPIPDISTLISGPPPVPTTLGTIISVVGSLEPTQPVPPGQIQIGNEINLNVFRESRSGRKINPAEIPLSGSGRHIPRDYAEAHDALDLIISSRAGVNNTAFRVTELKQIAKNLGLSLSGNKEELVNRIRTAVINYYGAQ